MIRFSSHPFGVTADKIPVTRYTMTNDSGMQVGVLDYACAVHSILVPDRNSVMRDVVLGYDSVADYEAGSCYFGALVGRYANRIKGAAFTLNGKTVRLTSNDNGNHLHGAFSRRVYDGCIEDDSLVFRFTSLPDEEGYPGTLHVTLRYRLTDDNALDISYEAVTDEDTVINLTNHAYFHLGGCTGGDVLDHVLYMDADAVTACDKHALPTGDILPVADTPLDFRTPKLIGKDLFADCDQLRFCGGYDHNYILNHPGGTLSLFARATCPESGVCLSAYTTEPGVQLYTGNFVDKDAAPCGKGGVRYPRYGGFCLETQHYPCSPNYPHFPSVILHPGDVYRHRTVYRFSTDPQS